MQAVATSILNGDISAFDGAGLIVLFVLWLILTVLVPRPQRRRLRAALVCLLGYVALVVWITLAPPPEQRMRYVDAAGAFLLLLSIGRLASVFVFDWLATRRLHREPPKIVRDVAEGMLVVVALLVMLRAAGMDPSSLLTTSALLTAIVGLSMQDTLGNLFAGLSLQGQQPFSVGEWISIDPANVQLGQVVEINWRSTKLRTSDNAELVIPNGQLARSIILNHSRPTPDVRRSVAFSVPYEFPTRAVQELALRAIANLPGVQPAPEPTVVSVGFNDYGVGYQLRYFIAQFERRDAVDSAVRDRLVSALHRAGMTIATVNYPARLQLLSAEAQHEGHDHGVQARTRAIRDIGFLKDLPDDAVGRLGAGTRTELYEPGEVVVRQGDHAAEMYLCLAGELVVVHTGDDGARRELARLSRGGMFGELSLMTGEPRSASVQAVTACELLMIEKTVLSEVLADNPRLAEVISTRLAERQAELDAIERAVTPAEQRASVESQKGQLLRRVRDFFAL
jgi:small-conductance mechanosensitive channel/CRP-like cAMP-binding protein